ncbi:MAG: efflux RND transporter permease subunit [Longimicrobiales bacterium]
MYQDESSPQEGLVARFTRGVIRHRRMVLLAGVAMTALAGVGARHLGLSTDYRTFFSEDNPDLVAYQDLEDIYSQNDNVLFVVRPNHGDVFTEQTLEALRDLTEDAWQIPHSTRVDAISNFQHTWADGDELIVEDLVPTGEITPAVAERARRVAMNEPLLLGRLVAKSGLSAGVNVRIALPGVSTDELPATVEAVRGLEREYRERYPELDIQSTGVVLLNMAFAEAPTKDAPLVMPAMFVALLLAVVVMLRSTGGTVGTFIVILLSTLTAVGVAGHLGIFLDPVSAAAPVVILTMAVADSVHIILSYFHQRRTGLEKDDAIVEAMVINAQPVFLTSLTTAIGFLTLNFGDSPPFRLLGNLTAFGVGAAWFYSMTVLPAVLAMTRGRVPVQDERSVMSRAVECISHVVTQNSRQVLVGSVAVVIALLALVPTIRINDQYFEYFDHSLPIRPGTEFAMEHLTGPYVTSFSLEAGEAQGVSDPEYLAAVEDFTEWLEGRPGVAHVNSFSHTMKRLNMNMHGDDPAYFEQPDSRELGAQYLLLYEMSLPYGLDVNDQINVDKSALRLEVTYGNVDVSTIEQETLAAEAWLQEHGTPSMKSATGTGPAMMFAKITRRNITSMIWGTGFGFLLISGILMFALRSVRMGVISLIPNVVPTLMAFGVWALLVGEVGFAVSVIAGLSIGIIVDDTVHFLSKYNRARRRTSAREAVEYAFEHVGPALVATTIIVSVGFSMLGMSTFRVTAYMGGLTALTVMCALVVDFLLLPALLIALDGERADSPATKAGSHPARQPLPASAS